MHVHTDWLLTAQRVAIHLPTATAVLADLHLGYHAARRRRGEAVPLMPVAEILAPLANVLRRWQLMRVVIAGDLFEDGIDEPAACELQSWLTVHRAEIVAVIPGNHDRRLADISCGLPVCSGDFCLQQWRVVHGDRDLPSSPAVFGHFHPCIRLGPYLRPCYLVSENRLMLPAFSGDARGVDVRQRGRWRGWRRLVPVADDVLDFGPASRKRKRPG
jgi:uncharacterized protein